MPRNLDIQSVLVLGAGPIQIGQACEFDYSGTQALKALREEGVRTILLNSNPASIMTDPARADATYVEPLTLAVLEKILERERPDALLPTVGGQTALNLAMEAHRAGLLERFGVRLIGAQPAAIERGEDREQFKALMDQLGLDTCRGGFAHSLDEARALARVTGFPAIIRPSYTLGGSGGGIAYNIDEFEAIIAARPGPLPDPPGAGGGEHPRLEGVRAGGGARPGRQRGDHLRHRERRSHGHPHRRQHHRGAHPHPHRPGVPAHARSRQGGDPGRRGGDRRQQHPVRARFRIRAG